MVSKDRASGRSRAMMGGVTVSTSPSPPTVKALRVAGRQRYVVKLVVSATVLLSASAVSAVPVYESPQAILAHRRMPLALMTIAGGLVLLWSVPTPGERVTTHEPQGTTRDRWGHVALCVCAIYLPIADGPELVNALVRLLGGPEVFRRAVSGLGALVGLTVAGIVLRRTRPLRAYLAFAGR